MVSMLVLTGAPAEALLLPAAARAFVWALRAELSAFAAALVLIGVDNTETVGGVESCGAVVANTETAGGVELICGAVAATVPAGRLLVCVPLGGPPAVLT